MFFSCESTNDVSNPWFSETVSVDSEGVMKTLLS